MANQQHVDILNQGPTTWNGWRHQHPSIIPDLRHADLANANLEHVNLAAANLRGARLEKANLRHANLEKSDLAEANLNQAILYRSSLIEASLQRASLRDANLHKSTLEGTNLTQANLTGATLNHANLKRSNLCLTNLVGAKFKFADLRRCQLFNANGQEANFSQADLRFANAQSAKLDRANLHLANLTRADLRSATLRQADLSKAILQQIRLQEADLEYANLYLADLQQANLDYVQGQQSVFTKATLIDASLAHACLRHAKFDQTIFNGGNLTKANLEEVDFQEADLSNTLIIDASLKQSQLIQTNFANANLRLANLAGASLKRANFLRADLSHATFDNPESMGHVTISESSFGMANLTGARFPPDLSVFRETLKNVEHTSNHARVLHVWVVGICLFSLLTISTLLGNQSFLRSTTFLLPIINLRVPTLLFVLGIPTVTTILFLYFHFYLTHLYQALSKLPAHFPDGLSLKEKLYPWMLNLCMHEWQLQSIHRRDHLDSPDFTLLFKELKKVGTWSQKIHNISEMTRVEERLKRVGTLCRMGIVAFVGWGLLPLTIGAFTCLYQTDNGTSVSYLLLGILTIAGLICSLSFESTRMTMKGTQGKPRWLRPMMVTTIIVLCVVFFLNQRYHFSGPPSVVQYFDSHSHLVR